MSFTLHRYIFYELLKVVILATVGLTLILSLGGMLRPAQEYGVGPRQVAYLLLYFMPVTLTFVLPMAALFAGALVYGRLASDNELDACRASGLSILTLVYPGGILAILVAIASLLLSSYIMPPFIHLAEKSIKDDARQILFRSIQRRSYFALPPDRRYLIYADYADPATNTLYGIVAVQSEEKGLKRILTCDWAQVQLNLHDRFNELHLVTHKARQIRGADDVWFEVEEGSFRQEFGSLLGDRIKFKKIEDMKQIRNDLMLFDPVARLARDTYAQLATELLARDIGRYLESMPKVFYELKGPSRRIRFTASACAVEEQGTIELLPPVVVEEYDNRSGRYLRRLGSEKTAAIRIEEEDATIRVGLDLRSAKVEETEQLVSQYGVLDLTLPERMQRVLNARPLLQTAVASDHGALLGAKPSKRLTQMRTLLRREADLAIADLGSEMNSRLVFGIGCIPMILIGIGLGVLQKGGHLLSAFGASCLPGAVLIIAIVSGKNMARSGHGGPTAAALVMWAGLAFLVLLTVLVYRKLLRT
ncbi:MAG: LptF/LptG family permease [Planctomycetes bacterium]|jgi:lipopolysaccharide export LptBFGC system permease protein LptF|nr:LptF/LptG family permease [Planctomycetota bacterium]